MPETESLYRVPVKRMAELVDPFRHRWYFDEPLTREEIMAEVAANHLEQQPSNVHEQELKDAGQFDAVIRTGSDRVYHLRRIAFFVKNGIPQNDPYTISAQAGSGKIHIIDGRHRFIAAFIRDDETIDIKSTSEILRLIPDAKPLPSGGVVLNPPGVKP